MAKVLIQQGIKNHLKREAKSQTSDTTINTENFRDTLERQSIKRLKGGIKNHLEKEAKSLTTDPKINTDNFRDTLERQSIKRLKGAPQRIRYTKKSENK